MARLVMIMMVAAAFVLAACGASVQTAPPEHATGVESGAVLRAPPQGALVSGGAGEAAPVEAVVPAAHTGLEASGDRANAPAEGNQLQYGSRMVILTAHLAMEVESVDHAEAQLRTIVDRAGGYLLRVRTSGEGERKTSYISFRVPSERFERVLSDAEGIVKRVISRAVDGEDVTEQYVDLESQLRNLEATRERLNALLERSGTLEETLRVHQAISEVQGRIEQVKGRMRYLEQNTNYSTITVELHPFAASSKAEPKAEWDPGTVLSQQIELVLAFFQSILTSLIVIAVWSPVWLILLLLIIWFWRVGQNMLYREQRLASHSSDTR
ncbi:DUF4349 domain-containing protein [uncultured Chloroflexus sp.]|uniref:DUF4349 domain-containing protein n=1 Tax=uncultured Chloroflexus sp. TaxID=214040 RepID=UPI0026101A44|nr:DUF4349 domain-containing protein [uncultured Chloroflexus sp.]